MKNDPKIEHFYKTEPIYMEKTPSSQLIRDQIEKEGFETSEIRFAKAFFAVMVCKNQTHLPRGQHLVVAAVKNVQSSKEKRNWYILFGKAENCSTVVPLPPQFINTIPEKIKEKNATWLRECSTLYLVKTAFKKPKVVKFKQPIELVDDIKSTNIYVCANPCVIYDIDNKVRIDVSIDKMAQMVIACENTIAEAKIE